MNKSILTNFISKYNISDVAGSDIINSKGGVNWQFSGNKLSTTFRSKDKTIVGFMETFNSGIKNMDGVVLGIKDSTRLLKLLEILDDDIEFSYKKSKDGSPNQLHVKDTKTDFYLSLCSPDVSRDVPRIKSKLPSEFTIHVKITEEFVNKFLRAETIFPKLTSFSIRYVDKKCKLFLGRDDVIYDRIEIQVETTKLGEIEPQFYDVSGFANALSVNKGVDTEFLISNEGIALLEYKTNEYDVQYFFLAKKESATD